MTAATHLGLSIGLPILLGIVAAIRTYESQSHLLPTALSGLAVIAQPGFFLSGNVAQAAFLAVALYATASSSLAVMTRQEPRRIALFSSSLAGTQLANPLCGILAAVMLPMAMRGSLQAPSGRRNTGLFVSLLFLPALVSAGLVFVYLRQHLAVAHLPVLTLRPKDLRLAPWPVPLLLSLPAAVALWSYSDRAKVPVFAVLILCVMAANFTASSLGGSDLPAQSSVALTSILLVTLSEPTPERPSSRRIVLLTVGNLVWMWAVLLLSRGYWHA